MKTADYSSGYSLIELMIALVVTALLASVAIPAYNGHIERAKTAKAIGDIRMISVAVEKFRLNNNDRVPDTLAELGMVIPDDPWGRSYSFLNIIDGDPKISEVRKDGALNPLNNDFDLYSLGEDGQTQAPLNAARARDDIVRANNGAYIGAAEDY